MTDRDLDYRAFDALTFDCYGTLIDWETGLLAALRAVLDPASVTADDETLLETYAAFEAEAESGAYRSYREVLAAGLRGVCAGFGVLPTDEQVRTFGGSVADWPAFPDSAAALAILKTRFRLGVTFDWVVTAEQARGYKPNLANFALAFERIGLPRDRILHVAQSLYHDHVPAKTLGMTTVWIDRRHDRTGSGATPPADARPDATFPDMAGFAAAAVA